MEREKDHIWEKDLQKNQEKGYMILFRKKFLFNSFILPYEFDSIWDLLQGRGVSSSVFLSYLHFELKYKTWSKLSVINRFGICLPDLVNVFLLPLLLPKGFSDYVLVCYFCSANNFQTGKCRKRNFTFYEKLSCAVG